MTALEGVVGSLIESTGLARLFASMLDYALVNHGEDAAKSMLRILVQRVGPQVVRGELDQYEAGRAVADAVEQVKFGAAK